MPNYNFDKSFKQVEDLPPGQEKAAQWAVYGLFTDGGHRKQWFLEQVLVALDVDLADVIIQFEEDGEWEPGIAP